MSAFRSCLVFATVVAVVAIATPAEATGHESWVQLHAAHGVCGLGAVSTAADRGSGAVYGLYDDNACSMHSSLLIAYTETGTQKWVVENTSHDDTPVAVAVDAKTHTVVIAATRNNNEMLVQAFDPDDGHELWGKGIIAKNASFATDGLVIDDHGRVIVSGTVTRDSTPSWSTAAFDLATGATLWHVNYAGEEGLGATATAIANYTIQNLAFIVGTAFTGSRDNLLTVAYNLQTGQIVWEREIKHLNPTPVDIAVDYLDQDVYVLTGSTTSTVAETIAYDRNGTLLWRRSYAGTGDDGVQPRAIGIDSALDRIYVAGEEAGSFTTVIAYTYRGRQVWTATDPVKTAIAVGVLADNRVYVTSDLITGSSTSRIVTTAYSVVGDRQWRDVYAPAGQLAEPGAITEAITHGVEYVAGDVSTAGTSDISSVMIAYRP